MHDAPPRRILLVRLSHLGDVVHALPVYHALRAAHPRAELAWAVQTEFAGLLEGLPGLAEIVPFDRRAGARAWPRVWSLLRAFSADWAIDAQGNVKSALVTLGSGARRRSGMHRRDWTEPFGASVLTDHAERVGRDAHALARIAALVRHVAPGWSGVLRTDPELAAHEVVEGRARCAELFGDARAPAILQLAPQGDVRSWPPERFEELARALGAAGRPVLVLSGPAEEDVGRALAARLAAPSIRHWVGQRGLRSLAALLRAAAERDGEFVGCDSGPLHLAAAAGMRVVCLAGPQDERRTGPWPVPEATVPGATMARAPLPGAMVPGAAVPGATSTRAAVPGATILGAMVPGASLAGASVIGSTVAGAPLGGSSDRGDSHSPAAAENGAPPADVAPRHAVVRARSSPACAPCLARRCRHPEGVVCMRRIEAADVLAALR